MRRYYEKMYSKTVRFIVQFQSVNQLTAYPIPALGDTTRRYYEKMYSKTVRFIVQFQSVNQLTAYPIPALADTMRRYYEKMYSKTVGFSALTMLYFPFKFGITACMHPESCRQRTLRVFCKTLTDWIPRKLSTDMVLILHVIRAHRWIRKGALDRIVDRLTHLLHFVDIIVRIDQRGNS